MPTHHFIHHLYAPANDTPKGSPTPTNCSRVRAFSPKVRTGCITCKIRRKKCDEEKPICRRCRDSRLKCDGYAHAPPEKKKPGPRSYTPTKLKVAQTTSVAVECVVRQSEPPSIFSGIGLGFDLDGSAYDRLYFHHFRVITMVDFVRFTTPRDFWSWRVLPMCHKEPAIRHAVVALGAAHHFYLQTLSKPSPGATNMSLSQSERIATQHYNKAIGELVRFNDSNTRTPWDAQLIMMTCCVLFIILENILGRFDEAVRHMRAGARFFESTNLSVAPYESRQLMQEIATILLHFGVDVSILAQGDVIPDMTPYATPLQEIDEGPRPFLSLTEAKDAIWDLDVRMSRIDIDYDCPDPNGPASENGSVENEMRELVAPFERWKAKFGLLVLSLSDSQVPRIDIQREILALTLRSCIWDLLLLPENETEKERLSELCHELIDLAGRLYGLEASCWGRPMFTLDSDSIPALTYVAMVCEDPVLIQRIVVLLRQSRRREGSWDSWEIADAIESKSWNSCDENACPVAIFARSFPE